MGPGRRCDGADALRAEAARHPADVGGTPRARGDRALAPGTSRGVLAVRGVADRGHRAPDADGVEGLARRRLPAVAEAAGPLRARVRGPGPGRRLAGPAGSRRPLPAQLPPAARSRRDQAHPDGPVDHARGHRLVRLGGRAGVHRARLRVLEPRRPAAAPRLEDRGRRVRRLAAARRLRSVRAGSAPRGPASRRSPGGQPARGQGHGASLERGEPRPGPRSAPALHAIDEGVPEGPGQQRRRGVGLRADGGPPHLPVVQFPRDLPPFGEAAPSRGQPVAQGAES